VPITSTYDPTHRIEIVTVTAPYTFKEWRAVMDGILEARPGPTSFLVDRRTAGVPTSALIDDMVSYFRLHAERLSGSTAAVVVGEEAAYGMARMLAIRAEVGQVQITMKIFLDYAAALGWLQSIDRV
jgi:hypothetical protein